ncbi:MAG: hypothetical protein C4313_00675 [Thermoflexus sp.]|uniref:twin-arginine translocation signal domain-containing protein n=1 Tax=Thermoflexus sp. TaxID=1969742 RepID=UPI00332C26AC
MKPITRRQFLKLGGAAGLTVAAAGVLGGYRLWAQVEGTTPPFHSPFQEPPDRRWPFSAGEAPILLILNERADPSTGAYLAEILRTEGLNVFRAAPLSALREEVLARFSLVLLSAGPLDTSQGETLRRYVAEGGRLVAMRPPASLADLFGVEPAAGQTVDGYIRIDPTPAFGQGFPRERLQFHGTADHYRPAGAETLAWLSSKTGDLPFPAVAWHPFGRGQAGMWAFDLAWSVALTRQGDPLRADQERDGLRGVRAHERFAGWIDLDRIEIPQADEQMRLLSRMIARMLADRLPLPRLWYFPEGALGLLVATGDAHNMPPSAVEEVLGRVEARGGTFSVYYAPLLRNSLQRAWQRLLYTIERAGSHIVLPEHVRGWRARGHEFGLHPYVEEGLEMGWRRYWEVFTGMGYGPVPPTVRTHRVLWSGWVETARVQAALGIRMNLDFYHIGPTFRKADGEWAFGYFTGSGLPMRFVDAQGRVLDIFQQLTNVVDEHLIGWTIPEAPRLPIPEAVAIVRRLLADSRAGVWGAVGLQAHVDPFAIGGEPAARQAAWLEGILDAAVEHGIPIWSAERWLAFLEAREALRLEPIRWDPVGKRLSIGIRADRPPPASVWIGIPAEIPGGRLVQMAVDRLPVIWREWTWRGDPYAWVPFPGGAGVLQAQYG